MTRARRTTFRCCAAILAGVLTAAAPTAGAPAPAGEWRFGVATSAFAAEPNPLPRFLEAIQVAPASEFRLAVIHPIFVTQTEVPAAAPPREAPDPAAVPVPQSWAATPRDAIGVEPSASAGRSLAKVTNFGLRPLWAFPGDVLRLADGDYVVRSDALVAVGKPDDVPVFRVATLSGDEKDALDPRWAGSLPGPALLWTLLSGGKDKHVTQACADHAADAGLVSARKSPVELARGAKIAARVGEYRTKLAALPKPASAGRREWAGYALVLDGAFAAIEVFANAKEFAAAWPARIEGIAVEASLAELDDNVFDTDLAAPTDPDRHTALVKDALLSIYGLEPESKRVAGLGSVLAMKKDNELGRAVIDEAGAPQHVIWLRDPAHRRLGPENTEEPLSPGVIDRKGRPTEAEKRWRERRGKAGE